MCPGDEQDYARWREKVYGPSVAKSPERQARFASTSGFEIPELCGPWSAGSGDVWSSIVGARPDSPSIVGAELARPAVGDNEEAGRASSAPTEDRRLDAAATEEDRIGFPGEYPFTRGIQPSMYRGRFWTMRQYAGFSTARATNERYKFLLASGQTGLSVAFDLPTQMGYDSSDPLAEGEVGKVGVAIDTLEDMATLFDGIPQDKVTTSMTINAPATILLLMYQIVAENAGIDPVLLGGTIQNDILKEYMARGTYIFPPAPSMLLTVDSFRYCTQRLPQWNMISISGYHIREAGCSAAQEVAFTLADGIEYTQRAVEAGMDVDSFGGRLSFFFNAHNNFLEEVAKFRAARRLWARIMRERFGAKNPRSWMLRFHTQTAGSMLTAQQPYNNIVRTALQALASVLGGTQSLHTNGFDEALALPTEQSAEIALRTQQIIANESGVCDSVDPLGGSWYLEDLTDRIEAAAVAYIERIDGMGGMASAIERGYPQAEIQQQAYEWQKSIESGERRIVGVNVYQHEKEAVPAINRDNAAEAEQCARLEEYLSRRGNSGSAGHQTGNSVRDPRPWESACGRLSDLAASGAKSGYCEAMYDALRAGATEGEIVKALEVVWGRYRPAV